MSCVLLTPKLDPICSLFLHGITLRCQFVLPGVFCFQSGMLAWWDPASGATRCMTQTTFSRFPVPYCSRITSPTGLLTLPPPDPVLETSTATDYTAAYPPNTYSNSHPTCTRSSNNPRHNYKLTFLLSIITTLLNLLVDNSCLHPTTTTGSLCCQDPATISFFFLLYWKI